MAAPAITSVSPADGYTAFPVTGEIVIFFDTEIDLFTAQNAIFLYGPDFTHIIGPDQAFIPAPNPYFPYENGMRSPGRLGEQDIVIDVFRVDADGDIVEDQEVYSPDDLLFSKIVIRPKNALQEKTDYKLYLAGDSTVENSVSISTKTVFDPLAHEDNTSTGSIYATGYYRDENDTLNIEITNSGDAGFCTFDYWFSSDIGTVKTVQSIEGILELDRSIYIELVGSDSGSFIEGDTWTVELVEGEPLELTYTLSFTTASNVVVSMPDTVSSSPIIDVTDGTESVFEIIKTWPADKSSNLGLNTRQIKIKFSKEVDPTSVDFETVKLVMAASDFPDDTEPVPFSYIVDGEFLYINIKEH